jgi:hypothetical protein
MAKDIGPSGDFITTWASAGTKAEAPTVDHENGAIANTIARSDYYNNELYKLSTSINYGFRKGVVEWDGTKTYSIGDVVEHNDKLWVATSANLNSEPTDLNANWDRSLYRSEDAVVLRDGSKALTGNWDVGAFDVTNIGSLSATNANITNITADVNLSSNNISGVSTITATNGSFTNITSNVDFGANDITGVGSLAATSITSQSLTMTPEVPGTIEGGQLALQRPDTGSSFNQDVLFDVSGDTVRIFSNDHGGVSFKGALINFNNIVAGNVREIIHLDNLGVETASWYRNIVGSTPGSQSSYPLGTILMVYTTGQATFNPLQIISGSVLSVGGCRQPPATFDFDSSFFTPTGNLPGTWKNLSMLVSGTSEAVGLAVRVL